jgi:hypothetical protein
MAGVKIEDNGEKAKWRECERQNWEKKERVSGERH